MIRAVALACALAGLWGCDRAPVLPPPPAGVVHLLPADAPDVEIRGVIHPAVGAPAVHGGVAGEGTLPATGPLRVPVATRLPANLALVATGVLQVGDEVRAVQPGIERAGDEVGLRFDVPPADAGRAARWMGSVQSIGATGALSWRGARGPVWAGSRLQLVLGLEAQRCHELAPTLIALDLDDGTRRRPLLRRTITPPRDCNTWQPATVTVPDAAWGRIRLRARALPGSPPPRRIAPFVGDLVLVPPRGPEPPRLPNVVVVSLDTLGAKRLGVSGYEAPTSPNIDRLATTGAWFADAVSHYPSTAASHMTLFTSLLPAAHGVRGLADALAPGVPTLPLLLQAAGWRTAGFTEDATLNRSMGFARGFDTYRETRSANGYAIVGEAKTTFRRARHWIARAAAQDEPFFLFLHTYEVHSPYDPPSGFARAVRPRRPATAPRDPGWLHDGEIRLVDRLLAGVVATLDATGAGARTILVVTSDHGESFGEHGHLAHGTCLHEEAMRVPLLIRGPGIAPRVIDQRVGLVDLTPTLLALVGLPVPPGLHGRSLAPLLHGEVLPDRPLVAELRGALGPRADHPEEDFRVVWTGDDKVVLDAYRGIASWTNLRDHPAEEVAVAVPPDVRARTQPVLDWYATLRAPARQVPYRLPDAEAVERLRKLGYVE